MQALFAPSADTGNAEGACRLALVSRWRGYRLMRLFLPRRERRELEAVLAWHVALRAAERGGGVSFATLHALLEELEGEPDSVLALSLARVVRIHGISLTEFRGPLAEAERLAGASAFESRTALESAARRRATPEARVLLRVFSRDGERQRTLAEALAVGLLETAWIAELPADVARGRVRVATSDLAEHGLDLLSLAGLFASGDARTVPLVRAEVERARAQLAKGWPLARDLGPWRGRLLAFVLRWQAATLSSLEAHGYVHPAGGLPAGWLRALACALAAAIGPRAPW